MLWYWYYAKKGLWKFIILLFWLPYNFYLFCIYLYLCVYVCLGIFFFSPLMIGYESVNVLLHVKVTCSRSIFRFKECVWFCFVFIFMWCK